MTQQRLAQVINAMKDANIDVLGLSYGFDLPWLTGYHAMPLERLTMLVVNRSGDAHLVVPALEAPRVERRDFFSVVAWDDGKDPIDIVKTLVGNARSVAVSDQSWAATLLDLQKHLPEVAWSKSSEILGSLRAVKDQDEVAALARAGAAADSVAMQIQNGDIRFAGRTEMAVSKEITECLIDKGHSSVEFAIVGSGPNGASPHHEASSRIIEHGDAVVCDFGGAFDGYSSDTTRTFFVGAVSEHQREIYEVVKTAQQAGFEAARVGVRACDVDAAARKVITDAGFGDYFIHRLGHGIGVETHEGPYLASTNPEPLVAGNAFSIEPGIYIPGEFGVRIEDIIVATTDGPKRLNNSPRELTVVQ